MGSGGLTAILEAFTGGMDLFFNWYTANPEARIAARWVPLDRTDDDGPWSTKTPPSISRQKQIE